MMNGHWLGTALVVLAGLALLAGCDKDNYTLAYSHSLHVKDNGMACKDCHGPATQGRFAIPGHKACTDCHGDWIETKVIGPKTCGMCHKVKDLQALTNAVPAKLVGEPGGVFVHTAALTNRCNDCHGLLLDAKLKSVPDMTHRAKVKIRDQAHKWGMDCKACHVDLNPQTPPASHSKNWTRRHGVLGSQSDSVCGVCHRAETCSACHKVMMPDSHNNMWRLKTHGLRAAWDRARCMVCHEQDSCVACHSVTQPQSHNAAWKQNHCPACHASGTSSGPGFAKSIIAGAWPQHVSSSAAMGPGCTLCHDTNIGSHPDPHPAGWITQHCNTCHPGTPDAAQCQVCHGGDTIGSHPDPHPAGWRSQHCNTCHPGAPASDLCKTCHGKDLIGAHPDPHPAGWRTRHCFSCHAGSSSLPVDCATCHKGGDSVALHQNFWPPIHNRFGPGANCYDCHKP
jgi:hypothetical protein